MTIDVHGKTWAAVKALVSEGINDARSALEAANVDERRADFLRGRIDAFREIENLARPQTEIHLGHRPEV